MEENVVFKTSAFGFDKKSVINYIADLSVKSAEKTDEISRITELNASLSRENESLKNENSKLMSANSDLLSTVEELTKTISSLNTHIDELNVKVSKIDDIEGAEEKANRLMMDSLRYAESCIQNARKVSASISMSTKTKIIRAKDSVDSVSDDFKALTEHIEASIAAISERLGKLSNGLDEDID